MKYLTPKTSFTCIDLFAGIGGFRLALEALGGNCIHFSEIDRDAIDTYCTNFDERKDRNLGDITKITSLPPHDILTAGVPCQSWSIAGRNLGFDDDRGQLWNDTLFLLHQARPKAFIFENVKGLADPRNQQALQHILQRIHDAGYYAKHFVLTSSDYGVPQDRVRVYIIGFLQEQYLQNFRLPPPRPCHLKLRDVLAIPHDTLDESTTGTRDLFGQLVQEKRRYRKIHGMNDFFLFNDIRNGPTTIHSWDLKPTTKRQKAICLLMLRNRRKPLYGRLDGNPLSLMQLQQLDSTIEKLELDTLVDMGILKTVFYSFAIRVHNAALNDAENMIARNIAAGNASLDALRECRDLRFAKIPLNKTIAAMLAKGTLDCIEIRYEFRYTKISTGIEGINRIFLPQSETFPTLVASDTNDYVAIKDIQAETKEEYKKFFLQEIYHKNLYRKISKEESCQIQGFPPDFKLPENRSRWMKLLGNSVSVPVIHTLAAAIVETGCFSNQETVPRIFSADANPMSSIISAPVVV
ncbi:MAG TPA: DNA (cytosine-5-)-methyltransferase [Alicycliphilus sp.]|nr:DNA (cytosine-5-)-methyltransferase [Alicycliphilus sp.]